MAVNTNRQTTQNITKLGPIAGPNKEGYDVENQGTVAVNTNRQTTQNVTRIGPAGKNTYASYIINQKNKIALS